MPMIDTPPAAALRPVLSVSELISATRLLIERNLPLTWVAGEISNFTRATSGHCYFVLKDAGAQVRCVFFRNKAALTGFALRDGMQVEVRALPTMYEARGEFQLNVEAMRTSGAGALYEKFARLKATLEARGWFAQERKRALAVYPRAIGIVTSPHAAALSDVLTTLARRSPHVRIVIYPCAVQGRGAAQEIARAIRLANKRRNADRIETLIVCRGGGSIEDLWSFNEESVALAIIESALPVISGVGHETDFTICDFVADVRAPTPTGAAQLVARARDELDAVTRNLFLHARAAFTRRLEREMQRVDYLGRRLQHPAARIAAQRLRLRQFGERMSRCMAALIARDRRIADRLGRPAGAAHRRRDVAGTRAVGCARRITAGGEARRGGARTQARSPRSRPAAPEPRVGAGAWLRDRDDAGQRRRPGVGLAADRPVAVDPLCAGQRGIDGHRDGSLSANRRFHTPPSARNGQLTLIPRTWPMPNVIAPATAPISSIRAPLPHALRPVNRLISAPTVNNETAVSPTAHASLAWPAAKNANGTSGMNAPAANDTNDEIAAPHGEPSSPGLSPSSSRASVSSAFSGCATSRSAIVRASFAGMPFAS
jgi:exodeoxyribonuclease VII large subunit